MAWQKFWFPLQTDFFYQSSGCSHAKAFRSPRNFPLVLGMALIQFATADMTDNDGSYDLYELWVDITEGDVENPAQIIAATFDSRYIHTDLNHGDFLQVAAADTGLKEVCRDVQAVIFEVLSR